MFSFQLYSSRNFPPLDATLRMLAATGYSGVEGHGGLYPDAAALPALAAALTDSGLAMKTGHFSLAQVEDTPDFVLQAARALGMERIYVPYLMPEDRPRDGAGWRAFGARLERAGAPIRAAGLGFGWHNHDFEFAPTPDGAIPQAEILAGGPLLEWEMDVAWIVRGGADPLDWLARHPGRVTTAHVKDIAPEGQNAAEDGWADVGHGTVDWARILPALRAAGVRHFILEHDNPLDHARFAARSLASVKGY